MQSIYWWESLSYLNESDSKPVNDPSIRCNIQITKIVFELLFIHYDHVFVELAITRKRSVEKTHSHRARRK